MEKANNTLSDRGMNVVSVFLNNYVSQGQDYGHQKCLRFFDKRGSKDTVGAVTEQSTCESWELNPRHVCRGFDSRTQQIFLWPIGSN